MVAHSPRRLRPNLLVCNSTQTRAEYSPDFTNLLVTSKGNYGNWGVFRRSPMEQWTAMFAHWQIRSVLLVLFILTYASVAQVFAQASAEDTNDSSSLPTYHSTVSEVRVTFFATDENNHPLATLAKSDFAVVDNERVVRNFRSFTHSDETSLDVVALVDLSESVAPRFRVVMSDVLQLVAQEQSIPDDNISVLSFGGTSGGLRPAVLCSSGCRTSDSMSNLLAVKSGHNAALRCPYLRSRFHLATSSRRWPRRWPRRRTPCPDPVLGRLRHHQHPLCTRGAAGGAGRERADLLR